MTRATPQAAAVPAQRGALTRRCPYVGLVPFKEADFAYFFGRASEANLIAANLAASRLTVLYAPSGAGKSSVLRAGVLPRLRELAEDRHEDDGPAGTIVAYTRDWSTDPGAAVATAVAQAAAELRGSAADRDSRLEAPELSTRWLREVLGETGVDTIYLILDQFEEYLLYHPGRSGEGFVTELGEILRSRDLGVNVLISIREDGIAGLDRFKGTVPRLLDNYLRLAHLEPQAARSAIEGPLAHYNAVVPPDDRVDVEPGLVDKVLEQVRVGRLAVGREEPTTAGLVAERRDIEAPFLQLVLVRLWTVELAGGSRLLRKGTLDQLGGAHTIVQTHLDTVMRGLPGPQRDLAAQVFRHLVTVSGSKIALGVEDLAELTGRSPDELSGLLVTLCAVDRRILRPVPPPAGTTRATRYEIFHDVLGAAVLAWRRRYLADAERAAAERRLLAERAESEQRLVAERKQAESYAEVAGLKLRQTRLVALALVVVVVLVSALGWWAWDHTTKAQQSALLSQAAADLRTSPSASLREAVQAHLKRRDAGSRQAILKAASAPRGRVVAGSEPRIEHMMHAKDARRVVVLGAGGLLRVLGEDGRPVGPDGFSGLPGAMLAADVDTDGDRVAVVDSDGHAATVRLSTGERADLGTIPSASDIRFLPGSSGQLVVITTSDQGVTTRRADGTGQAVQLSRTLATATTPMRDGTVVTAHLDRRLQVWDARTGDRLAESPPLSGLPTFVEPAGPQQFVAVTEPVPDGATSSIVTWDWRSGAAPVVHEIYGARRVNSVSVDEAAGTVTLAADKTARTYQIGDGRLLAEVVEQPDSVLEAVVSPDRRWLATAGGEGVLVWSLAGPSALAPSAQAPTYEFLDHDGPVYDLEWVDGSRGLLSHGSDETVRRWDMSPAERVLGHQDWVLDLDTSGDGRWVATGSQDGTATVLRADAPAAPPAAAFEELDGLQAVRFNPQDPSQVVTLTTNGSSPQSWRWREGTVPTGSYFESIPDARLLLYGLAISGDGRTAASGDSLGFVHLWDTASGRLVPTPPLRVVTEGGGTGSRAAVALDPQGELVAAAGGGGVTVWQRDGSGRFVPGPWLPLPNVEQVAFDPTGRHLAGVTASGSIQLWDRDGTALRSEPLVAPGRVGAVSFSGDGRLVAAGTADGLVTVWEIETGEIVTSRREHGGFVNKVAFLTPDGSRVASASDDYTVAVWPCPACRAPDEVIEDAVAANGG